MRRLLLFISLALSAFGAVEVAVDAQKIGQEDTLGVQVVIDGEDGGPEIRSSDFEVRGSARSSQIQIINGAVSKKNIYQFDLGALRTGSLSFSVVVGKENKGPFAIEVVAGRVKAAPQARNPMEEFFGGNPWGAQPPAQRRTDFNEDEAFARNEVPKNQVWLGESIPVDTVLYFRVNIEQPRMVKEDSFVGFSVEPVADFQPKQTRAELNGQKYERVVLRRRILTPTLPGNAVIKGAVLRLAKSGGFWGGGPARDSKIADVSLEVRPLPEGGKPATFRGAVGEFTLNARLTPASLKAHDASTLVYELSGRGNFKGASLPTPSLRDPDLSSRRAAVRDTVKLGLEGQEGTMGVDYMLIPGRAKAYTIPGIEWSYFSPARGTYVTLRTPTLTLTATKPDQDVGNAVTITGAREVETQKEDIRYIQTGKLGRSGGGPFSNAWFLGLHGLALLIALGAVAWNQLEKMRRHGGRGFASRAFAHSQKILREAAKHADDPREMHRLTEEALRAFVHGRLGLSTGLSLPEWRQAVVARHGEGPQVDELFALIKTCQAARYAPVAPEPGASPLWERAETLLRTLDRAWSEQKGKRP